MYLKDGARDWKIVIIEDEQEYDIPWRGKVSNVTHTITLAKTKNVPLVDMEESFLHEIVHIAAEKSGAKDNPTDPEVFTVDVKPFTRNLYDLLKTNGLLMDWTGWLNKDVALATKEE